MSSKIRLGKYRDKTYIMSVRPPPANITNTKKVEDFAITIYYKENNQTHEIVRIDDSHGYTHMDKIYSQKEDIKKEMSKIDFWEAMNHLMENWKKYAKYQRQKQR